MRLKTCLGERFRGTTALVLAIVVIFLVTLLAFPLGCGKKEAEEIRIGAMAPLTGDNAVYGEALKSGADLAINQINTSGGTSGHKVDLLWEDSQAETQRGVAGFRKLVSIDKVPMVLGAMFSAVTLAIAPIAEREHVVLLSPTSSAVELSQAGDYIFRIYPSDSYDGEYIANFACESLKAKTASILYIQVASVTAITEFFEREFQACGGQILDKLGYNEGETDFRSQITRIRNSKPDVLFLPGYLQEMAVQLRQAKETGLNCPIISISTFNDSRILNLAGDAAEGVMFSTPYYDPRGADSLTQQFVSSFQSRYGREPNIWAGYGYDAVRVAAEAIARVLQSGSDLTASALKDQLYGIEGFPGVTGATTFDENGDVTKELKMMKVQGGSFIDY